MSIGVVAKTWLSDGQGLDKDVEDLLLGAGLGMLYKNRPLNQRGFSHGVVAILFRDSIMSLKEVMVHNPGKYEILMAVGAVKGFSHKIGGDCLLSPPKLFCI